MARLHRKPTGVVRHPKGEKGTVMFINLSGEPCFAVQTDFVGSRNRGSRII